MEDILDTEQFQQQPSLLNRSSLCRRLHRLSEGNKRHKLHIFYDTAAAQDRTAVAPTSTLSRLSLGVDT